MVKTIATAAEMTNMTIIILKKTENKNHNDNNGNIYTKKTGQQTIIRITNNGNSDNPKRPDICGRSSRLRPAGRKRLKQLSKFLHTRPPRLTLAFRV